MWHPRWALGTLGKWQVLAPRPGVQAGQVGSQCSLCAGRWPTHRCATCPGPGISGSGSTGTCFGSSSGSCSSDHTSHTPASCGWSGGRSPAGPRAVRRGRQDGWAEEPTPPAGLCQGPGCTSVKLVKCGSNRGKYFGRERKKANAKPFLFLFFLMALGHGHFTIELHP